MHSAVGTDQFSAPLQRLHVLNLQNRQEVILLGEVPDCPQQASRRDLRLGLQTKLYPPSRAILVADIELGIRTVEVFLDKRVGRMRFVSLSTGPVECVA